MNNIFKNAYFGKAYKTRDGRKALFCRKDDDVFDLETEDAYNPVRADGHFLYTKEGYESCCDIVSEWTEEVNDEELDELAANYSQEDTLCQGIKEGYSCPGLIKAFKAGYHRAL